MVSLSQPVLRNRSISARSVANAKRRSKMKQPTPKQQARINIRRKLESDLQDVRYKINSNLREFRRLTEVQSALKRERVIRQQMLRDWELLEK